jgi:hypothetical protein
VPDVARFVFQERMADGRHSQERRSGPGKGVLDVALPGPCAAARVVRYW